MHIYLSWRLVRDKTRWTHACPSIKHDRFFLDASTWQMKIHIARGCACTLVTAGASLGFVYIWHFPFNFLSSHGEMTIGARDCICSGKWIGHRKLVFSTLCPFIKSRNLAQRPLKRLPLSISRSFFCVCSVICYSCNLHQNCNPAAFVHFCQGPVFELSHWHCGPSRWHTHVFRGQVTKPSPSSFGNKMATFFNLQNTE